MNLRIMGLGGSVEPEHPLRLILQLLAQVVNVIPSGGAKWGWHKRGWQN